MMPDKSKVNKHEDLISWFVLNKKGGQTIVDFIGTEDNLIDLRQDNFMGLECVDAEIQMIENDINNVSQLFKESILNDKKIITPISIKCKSCEYKIENDSQSGFVGCWGNLADPSPHILELGYLGHVNNHSGNVINELISRGKTALSDIPLEYVVKEKPYYNDRPFYQLKVNHEFLLNEFNDSLMVWESKMSFEPIVGKTYYLYDFDGKKSAELRNQWWTKGNEENWTFLFYHDIQTPLTSC
jgi:hypothetical protein